MYEVVSFTKFAGKLKEREVLALVDSFKIADMLTRACNQVAPANVVVQYRKVDDDKPQDPKEAL